MQKLHGGLLGVIDDAITCAIASFKVKCTGVTILQGVEFFDFPILLLVPCMQH